MVSWLFLLGALVGAWFTYNGIRPTFYGDRRAVLSFFAGWLTTELALHHIAWQLVLTLAFVALGALEGWPGKLALAITFVSWAGLAWCYWRAREAEASVESALKATLGPDYRDRIAPDVQVRLAPVVDWKQILLPFPIRHPEVERIGNITYARNAGLDLKLDVYRSRSRPQGCPTLLQVHGGGWVIGTKNEQGLPLMQQMAARGWVCVSVDYRLSPHATFPDHLIDLKYALRWIREHGAEYGADPNFVVVTGGSAGGHLSALVGLTGNEPEYQPGFEDVDTSVRACVPFYGVYDFTDRYGHYPNKGLAELLEKRVMKAARHEAPEAYEKASPMSRVHAESPPFFVIHGDSDTLVPVDDARRFVALLRSSSKQPVAYAEIPGAQHAFEIFPSLRTTFVVHGVERFLAYVYSEYLQSRRGATATTSAVADDEAA